MKTPYYLIHANMLDSGADQLKQALNRYWPNSIVGYSFKTNSLPWILQYMKNQGFYAEVVSEDEYELAEYMGYRRIIYNGPVKGRDSFFRACRAGHILNLDAWRELEWLKEASELCSQIKIGIRVNFDLEIVCPGESSGGEGGGRFGFNYENGELQRVMDELHKLPGVQIAGIHLHCSSKTRSLNIYRAISRMACRIQRECCLELEYIDVGGGYFGGLPNKPQYRDYLKVMTEILREEFIPERVQLIVEPGTSLICPPIDYVTEVTDVKETNRNRFIVTDGSRTQIDPLMTKKNYFYHVELKDEEKRMEFPRQVICGFTCMENDRLFEMEVQNALKCGDRIVYEKVGAYTMCLSPLFSSYYPEVYVEREGRITCVRQKWGVREYIQKSVFEDNENECFDFKLRDEKQDCTVYEKRIRREGRGHCDRYESQCSSAL